MVPADGIRSVLIHGGRRPGTAACPVWHDSAPGVPRSQVWHVTQCIAVCFNVSQVARVEWQCCGHATSHMPAGLHCLIVSYDQLLGEDQHDAVPAD